MPKMRRRCDCVVAKRRRHMGLQVHVLPQKRAVKTDEARSRHGMERTQTTRRKEMLTAQDVADLLHVSRGWVYRHRDALSGFQPAIGCALLFPERRIRDIQEGNYAVSDERRSMACGSHDQRPTENMPLPNEGRGQKMGGRTKPRRLADKDRHNLLA